MSYYTASDLSNLRQLWLIPFILYLQGNFLIQVTFRAAAVIIDA